MEDGTTFIRQETESEIDDCDICIDPPTTTLPPQDDQAARATRRRKIIIFLYLNMTIQLFCMSIMMNCQAALVTITNFVTLRKFLVHARKRIRFSPNSVWRLDRTSPWLDGSLLNAHCENEFSRRCRVKPATFYYLCSLLAPALQKSKRGGGIYVEKRIALSLNKLGTGNYLLSCADLFGMSEGLASIVVREFCTAVLATIRPLVVPTFLKEALPKLATQFEAKHGIPFIMGAIDGSHIPIIAPPGDPSPFYNRKGFYSVLLQGIVDPETRFWDWDFGWVGLLHNYTLFLASAEGRATIRGDYLPYKLIGDAAYSFQTCMYVPFKGTKETLDPFKAHWNFVQSSTQMCVERAFGVLKGRWRILLRRNEMKFAHLGDVVGTTICLHNLCIMQRDFVVPNLVAEAKTFLHKQTIASFSTFRHQGTMKLVDYGKTEVDRIEVDVEELIRRAAAPEWEYDDIPSTAQPTRVKALKAGVTMHLELAKNLWQRHLEDNTKLPHNFYKMSSSSEDED